MTTDELIEEILSADRPQDLDSAFEGSCPCFAVALMVDGESLHLMGRCWRVGEHEDTQDLHVWGSLPSEQQRRIAVVLKDTLDAQAWSNPYTIMGEPDWERL